MKDPFDSWLSERPPDDAPQEGELLPGTVVDEYRIVALLGRGGFAEVYRAADAVGRPVAIKILHRLDGRSRARFRRESDVLLNLHHPNMPKLLGFGVCGNRPYLVTELFHPLELPRGDRAVARLLGKVIGAVLELHRHGWIHRDIKPSNVMVRTDGEPVLIDFGLVCPRDRVKREREGVSVEESRPMVVGTPRYSAPEQFNGQATGPEADVHALGALADACFSGKIPRCWRRIVLKATNSTPENRYRSVEALERAISWRHWLRNLSGLAALIAISVGLVLWFDRLHARQAIDEQTQDIRKKIKEVQILNPPTNEENVLRTNRL